MTDEPKQDEPKQELKFESDSASSRSFWIALVLTILVVLWMASGLFIKSPEPEEALPIGEVEPVSVAVKNSTAQTVTQFFQAEGQAQPDRDTSIRAKTSGQIAKVLVSKGQDVDANAVIAVFETAELEAELERAQAELERALREFENATELLDRGVATSDRVTTADAALATARAQAAKAEENLRNTEIIAPFAGRIETLDLDAGEFVQTGTSVGRIVDNTPLTVAIQVPQQSLGLLTNLQPARVLFITGEERAGVVSFVGTSAATDTRTFLVEIDVPNADGKIPAGISAEVQIPVGEVKGHFVSPSTISLDPSGNLGVKTVDEEDIVRFKEIDVVRAQVDGVWVLGLPETARIITVGQGFVRDGDRVNAQDAGDVQ